MHISWTTDIGEDFDFVIYLSMANPYPYLL